MSEEIELRDVAARPVAAHAACIQLRDIPRALIAGLDKVYASLRERGVTGLGCNIAIYRGAPDGRVDLLAGVETPAPLADDGEVVAAATPAGRAAALTHWGRYEDLGRAHAAIERWRAERGLASSVNWEVYGDWSDDPAGRRTDVFHLIEAERAA